MSRRTAEASDDDPTTRRDDDTPARDTRRKLVLRSILPDDPVAVELVGTRWTLGRAEPCDVRLRREGVSRVHAEVERKGPLYSIRDLGSTNGTYVDGTRIEHTHIARDSVLRLGEWLGIVEEHDALEPGPYHFRELVPRVWGGAVLARTLEPLVRAADSTLPIVLVGRTGTGKERFAQAVHLLGRPDTPFHALNCAALPPALAEAELFGYSRGAFTGAERGYEGHLRAAGRGTLFLDEIAELPLVLQAKLLRALDTGEIAPIGRTASVRFQARIVAACQVPLAELVVRGTFREDLAARIGGLVVSLPDVLARRGDVPSLFQAFLHWHSAGTAPAVSTRLLERLCLHNWRTNVREIELLARHMLAVHGLEPVLRPSHLPESMSEQDRCAGSVRGAQESPIQALAVALRGTSGNVKEAARAAGISRQRAYRLINTNGLVAAVESYRERCIRGKDGRDE